MTSPVRLNPIRLQRGGRGLMLRDKGHQSSKLYMKCEMDRWVRKIRPEESAKQGEKACDWLIEICANEDADASILEQVYVELKLKNHLETAIPEQSVNEGELLAFTVPATDPDLPLIQNYIITLKCFCVFMQ